MIFKSVHFPNQVVATRRGSPLLIGVKTPKKLKVDFVDVEFGGIAEERERKTIFSLFHDCCVYHTMEQTVAFNSSSLSFSFRIH